MIVVVDPFPSRYPLALAKALAVELAEEIYVVTALSAHAVIYRLLGFRSGTISGSAWLQNQPVALSIVYNENRPVWTSVRKLLQNCPVLYLERGLIRGVCCQASFFGTNANSSLNRCNTGEFPAFSICDRTVEFHRGVLGRFSTLAVDGLLVVLGSLEIRLRRFYFRGHQFHQELPLSTYVSRLFSLPKATQLVIGSTDWPSITLALQLEGDTQYKAQDCFGSNIDFVRFVVDLALSREICVVLRKHPLDQTDIKSLTSGLDLDQVHLSYDTEIECDGVVAINSTFLVDSLRSGKVVFSFGYSCFANTRKSRDVLFSEFCLWLDEFKVKGMCIERSSGTSENLNAFESNEALDNWITTGSLPGDLLLFDDFDIKQSAKAIVGCLS